MDCCCQQLSLTLWLWVALPAADVCSAGQISHAIFHEYIPLIRNQNFFQLCLFPLFIGSVSIHPPYPPVRPTACFFLRLTRSENAVAFHFMHATRLLKVMFHPTFSCLPRRLFWDVSRDKPELHSSIPKNLRSWLQSEHLPKIEHQRPLCSLNASSSGRGCALYCQNVKEKICLCAGHRHTAQHKLSLLTKRGGGVGFTGITVSTHGIVASTAPSLKDHTSSYPCLAELCWQKCLCIRHQLLPDFSL